jgi:hypothetical protein
MNDLTHGVLDLASAAAARAGSARGESESGVKATSYCAEDEEGEHGKRKHRRGAERKGEKEWTRPRDRVRTLLSAVTPISRPRPRSSRVTGIAHPSPFDDAHKWYDCALPRSSDSHPSAACLVHDGPAEFPQSRYLHCTSRSSAISLLLPPPGNHAMAGACAILMMGSPSCKHGLLEVAAQNNTGTPISTARRYERTGPRRRREA